MAADKGMQVDGLILAVVDLSFAYAGRPPALSHVDLRIEPGEILALVGQNGAGKTTLAKHFNGLLRPSSGSVWVGGRDASELSIGELAQHVGFVFQNPDHQIFAGTIREEIAFGPRNLGLTEAQVSARVVEVIEAFELGPHASLPPATLGYGLRRKVALASVFAMHPQALVLDEPTTGLDRKSVTELMMRLERFARDGGTAVVITHDVRLVADHIPMCAVLQAGRLVAYGKTRDLLTQDDLMAATGLELPPVGQLGRRLGMKGGRLPLDVGGFRRAWADRSSGRTEARR